MALVQRNKVQQASIIFFFLQIDRKSLRQSAFCPNFPSGESRGTAPFGLWMGGRTTDANQAPRVRVPPSFLPSLRSFDRSFVRSFVGTCQSRLGPSGGYTTPHQAGGNRRQGRDSPTDRDRRSSVYIYLSKHCEILLEKAEWNDQSVSSSSTEWSGVRRSVADPIQGYSPIHVYECDSD